MPPGENEKPLSETKELVQVYKQLCDSLNENNHLKRIEVKLKRTEDDLYEMKKHVLKSAKLLEVLRVSDHSRDRGFFVTNISPIPLLICPFNKNVSDTQQFYTLIEPDKILICHVANPFVLHVICPRDTTESSIRYTVLRHTIPTKFEHKDPEVGKIFYFP